LQPFASNITRSNFTIITLLICKISLCFVLTVTEEITQENSLGIDEYFDTAQILVLILGGSNEVLRKDSKYSEKVYWNIGETRSLTTFVQPASWLPVNELLEFSLSVHLSIARQRLAE
jgi:hypothetical protein